MAQKKTVESLVELLREVAPGLSETTLTTYANRLHRDLGGERRYFEKAPVTLKTGRLAAALAAGSPLYEAFDAAGVSRRSGFRMLKRKWGRRSP